MWRVKVFLEVVIQAGGYLRVRITGTGRARKYKGRGDSRRGEGGAWDK